MMTEARWQFLWNLGLLLGFVGLPAMLGYFAGTSVEATTKTPFMHWRIVFAVLGAVVGAFAGWRMMAPGKVTRRRD
jgi:hypothetical protein